MSLKYFKMFYFLFRKIYFLNYRLLWQNALFSQWSLCQNAIKLFYTLLYFVDKLTIKIEKKTDSNIFFFPPQWTIIMITKYLFLKIKKKKLNTQY